jgi:NAD(P)-dependent dehydrogenase (short-subunit alcohol dehydrogenase family)
VNKVQPGVISTELTQSNPRGMSEAAETRIQMRRVALDTVVAGAVALPRSDEASYMTGAHRAVGGGFLV